MAKPSILLVPGSFALPEFYDVIVDGLAKEGFEMRALHYPSVGLETGPREGSPPTMYDDAAFIAKETEKLADEGKDVILISHSYGGVPMTESCKGLGKAERQGEGKSGGIVRLAYMTALVREIGRSAADAPMLMYRDHVVEMEIDDQGWLHIEPSAENAAMMFPEVPREEGMARVKKMPAHSSACFTQELTCAGYKYIPVSYLVCENDLAIPVKLQRFYIDLIERESGNKVDVTSIKAGHGANFTAPEEVINWILDMATKA